MFNWLMNHVFDREGYRRFKDECQRLDDKHRLIDDLDRRIKKVFTPEEWAETKARCERKLAEMGY